MHKIHTKLKVLTSVAGIAAGVLLLAGGTIAFAQREILTAESTVLTTGRNELAQPPTNILPPGDVVRLPPEAPEGPVTIPKGLSQLEDAEIEYITGWATMFPSAMSSEPVFVDYINSDDVEVKARVTVFRHAQLKPVNSIDFTFDPHEAFGLVVGVPSTERSNFWVSIQATSPKFIVQNVRFGQNFSGPMNFGYEKIAAFELPSGERLW